MSIDTLSSVSIETVGRYERAAQHLTRAYLAVIERAARNDSERFAAALQERELPLVDERVKTRLIEAQQRVSEIVVQGLQAGSAALSSANERIAQQLKETIEQARGSIGRFEGAGDTHPLDTLALLGLPSAQLSLSVATALAEGAERLEARAVGDETVADAQPAPRKPAKRGARA